MAYIDMNKIISNNELKKMSRPELVILAAKLCRLKKIKPGNSLRLFENDSIDIDELREILIEDLKLPVSKPTVSNDSSSQSE
jgi:hypothetical protein